MSFQPSAPLMMALMTRNMTSTRLCLRLISERVSSDKGKVFNQRHSACLLHGDAIRSQTICLFKFH